MRPVEFLDIRGLRGDKGEEIDHLRAVRVCYGDCLIREQGHGDA